MWESFPWGTISAIIGGSGFSAFLLKAIDFYINRRRERTDERSGVARLEIDQENLMRKELSERLDMATHRADEMMAQSSKRIDEERTRGDQWHQKYWEEYGLHRQTMLERDRLVAELFRAREERDRLREDCKQYRIKLQLSSENDAKPDP